MTPVLSKILLMISSLAFVLTLTSCVSTPLKKITLLPNEYRAPATLKLHVKPHPEVPRKSDSFPKFSVVLTADDFNVSEEHYIANELHRVIGRESSRLHVEIRELYVIDYYSDRLGFAKRQASAAAVASVSPVVSAILSGDTSEANGVVFVIGQGMVNGNAFDIRTELPYKGINDPALNDRVSYTVILKSALNKAAQQIIKDISKES